MTTPPERLYRPGDLYDAWDPADARSWANSFDGRTYLRFVREGLRAPESDAIAVDRALHAWQVPAFALAAASDHVANDTIGIPTWLYGQEPPTPFATQHAKYFENSIREDGLLALAVHGIVYLPGSAGTLQEVFQDAAQNFYRSVRGIFSPMVFLDLDEHWSETFPIRPVIEALLPAEDRSLVCWTTDIDEAIDFIDGFRIPADRH